jgi:hypothetical protein
MHYSIDPAGNVGSEVNLTVCYVTTEANYGTVTPPTGWYDSSTWILLKATAPTQAGIFIWNGWKGEGHGAYTGKNNPAEVRILGPIVEKAQWLCKYTLLVGVSGSGTTNATGSQTYDASAVVSVQAFPSAGWVFSGWLLNGSDAGSANPCTLTMDSDYNLTALFTKIPPIQYKLLVQVQGLGTTNATGIQTYDVGTTVAIEADPDSGWIFACWLRNGTNIGSTNPYEVTMSENINLTAVFVPENVFVVPEIPLGTIAATASMIIALAAYMIAPKWRRKNQHINP